jgi:hypothetical protein
LKNRELKSTLLSLSKVQKPVRNNETKTEGIELWRDVGNILKTDGGWKEKRHTELNLLSKHFRFSLSQQQACGMAVFGLQPFNILLCSIHPTNIS